MTVRETVEKAYRVEQAHHETAQRIVDWLEQHAAGKTITETTMKKLREAVGLPDLRLRKQYGMTHIDGKSHYQYKQDWDAADCVSLLIAHTETSPQVNIDLIRKQSCCYLDAAVQRNNLRRRMLGSDQPERIDRLIAAVKDAWVSFGEEVKYPMPDQHDIERLLGLEEKRER